MSITLASIITNLDTYTGESSTTVITTAQRVQAINEATVWLQEELMNDLQNVTSTIDFYDTVHYYKVTSTLADLLEGADLRRAVGKQTQVFAHKSAQNIAEDIGRGYSDPAWAIERRDGDSYLVINYSPDSTAKVISSLDSTTSGGGTWEVDDTNSDATNLTVDTNEFKQGSASLNFDVDVSQSGNDRATIVNSELSSSDFSDFEDISAWLLWIYVPDVTDFTSLTLYWGSDSSNYWSVTATTDIDGAAFTNGWNRIKVNWSDATKTSSPDVTAIDYIRIDFNYSGSQGDDTDFRIDELLLARPEKLTFHYVGWYVGTNSSGTDITTFTAATDVPYFSGQYDQYRYPVAHKAAAIVLRAFHLFEEGQREDIEAERALQRARNIIPSSRTPITSNFKVKGIRFNKR